MRGRTIDGIADVLERDVSRRDALKALAGGGAILGSAKAIDNVLLGYGDVVGTNLIEQDLAPLADRDFHAGGGEPTTVAGYEMVARREGVRIQEEGEVVATIVPGETTAATGRSVDANLGLPGVAEELARDLGAVDADEHVFEFSDVQEFLGRVRNARTRPYAVSALRGYPADVDPGVVERFAGVDAADPAAILSGLIGGFREHAFYDVPRYVAGSIQFNVLMNTVDVRAPFREPVDYESLLAGEGETGMFCNEFTLRAIEALHAVPAPDQTIPVLGAWIWDARHKHVYLGVASVVREDGDLVVPMTFVDYTHTTLYDDLNLRGIMGEGFEAYNERHRATAISWDPYPD